jgi:hypothetical protein
MGDHKSTPPKQSLDGAPRSSHPSDKNKSVARVGHPAPRSRGGWDSVLSHLFDKERRMDGARGFRGDQKSTPPKRSLDGAPRSRGGWDSLLSHPFDKERRMDGARGFRGDQKSTPHKRSLEGHPGVPTLATKTKASRGWGTPESWWMGFGGFPPIRQRTSNGWGTGIQGRSKIHPTQAKLGWGTRCSIPDNSGVFWTLARCRLAR